MDDDRSGGTRAGRSQAPENDSAGSARFEDFPLSLGASPEQCQGMNDALRRFGRSTRDAGSTSLIIGGVMDEILAIGSAQSEAIGTVQKNVKHTDDKPVSFTDALLQQLVELALGSVLKRGAEVIKSAVAAGLAERATAGGAKAIGEDLGAALTRGLSGAVKKACGDARSTRGVLRFFEAQKEAALKHTIETRRWFEDVLAPRVEGDRDLAICLRQAVRKVTDEAYDRQYQVTLARYMELMAAADLGEVEASDGSTRPRVDHRSVYGAPRGVLLVSGQIEVRAGGKFSGNYYGLTFKGVEQSALRDAGKDHLKGLRVRDFPTPKWLSLEIHHPGDTATPSRLNVTTDGQLISPEFPDEASELAFTEIGDPYARYRVEDGKDEARKQMALREVLADVGRLPMSIVKASK